MQAVAGDVSSIGAPIGMHRAPSRPLSFGNGAVSATEPASAETQQQVQKLRQSDANVRQHEAAHQSAGGGHAGAASFTYTRGPDGKSYATAGEVQVDISAEADPSSTVAKMEQVKAAALAPNDPSPQDLRVAAQADAQKLKAESEQRQQGGGTAPPALAARGASAYAAAQTAAQALTAPPGGGLGRLVV
ncbi:putative metalloprotease CJM1_0395 family protein [Azospirillum doebereinerae]|uniref:Catalase n=1 Tax=Azospirillum doebereinerae TaxID=92933 RepID=A0A433J4R2_9PROT|nr:hypothetical protein EJ913_21155 [Azospirillum doebereinerae]